MKSWKILHQPIQGFSYGCRYPSIQILLSGRALSSAERSSIVADIAEYVSHFTLDSSSEDPEMDWSETVQWLLRLWKCVQHSLGLPVHETGHVIFISATQARCIVPTTKSGMTEVTALIQLTLDCLKKEFWKKPELSTRWKSVIHNLSQKAPKSSNVFLLVQTAFELGIPFRELPGNLYQYGIGRRARWLNSTFTDATPYIASHLSHYKFLAAAILREAGIPVPDHHMVNHQADAVKVAQILGYPVVVKPADTDGGKGVQAGLLNDMEVKQAFDLAQKHSRRILVEKHVEGRDYRINVFNGKAVWAIERVPAGVTGDGLHTIDELVMQANADPRRGSRSDCVLKPLAIDAEAERLMAQQGIHADEIPTVGQFVRLKKAANVSSGGTPVPVFDQLHPDNALLAVRATEALRLDLAGVDLLIPDISVSWHDSGAAICEVNAQPQLGKMTSMHLYRLILQELLPERGRIPTVVVFGPIDPLPWIQALVCAWAQQGLCVGTVAKGMVQVGDEVLQTTGVSVHDGGNMLALNRKVDAMVLVIEDDQMLKTGLHADRIDALILAGSHLRIHGPVSEINMAKALSESLRLLLPMSDGVIIAATQGGLNVPTISNLTTARVLECDGDIEQMVQQAVQHTMA
jgi:cyanophycin synthetase